MDTGVWEIGAAFVKALTYATTLSAAGLAFFYVYAPSGDVPARNRQRPMFVLAGSAALLSAVKFPLLAGAMDGLAGAVSPAMLHRLVSSGEGTAAALRAGGLILLCAGAIGAAAHRAVQTLGALLAATSFAALGHVHAHHSAALTGLLALHLICAAFWIGALWPLERLLVHDPPRAVRVIARFSRLALAAVPMLLLAGLVLLAVLLGTVSALWSTSYGRWLCVKLALVTCLLLLAARNRQRLTPRLDTPDGRAAMRRAIHAEMVVAGGIVAVTAVLTTLMGPGD